MRRRPIPSVEESLAGLVEQGVTDAPTEGPDADALRGLLDLALFVAEHRKKVSFPSFHWDDPSFLVQDAKVAIRVAYATYAKDATTTLLAALPRIRDGRTLLAMDAHVGDVREYEVAHELFGQVTLFQWPSRPAEPTDLRVWDAVERGWTSTLKEHNLLPGRGLVVLDEHQGLLLRDDRLRALAGVLLLLSDGQTRLWWNPFVAREHEDSELQYWLKWGPGTGMPSGWKETFYAEGSDD